MLAADVVVRAREAAAIRPAIRYHLGAGGRRPGATTPADAQGRCDCSGFAAWCLGIDRKTAAGVWLNTDEIERDARTAGGLFDRLAEPRVGCLVVYGAGPKIGHVGVVVETPLQWTWMWATLRVIHCAAHVPAIRETDAAGFGRHGAIFAWYRDLAG